MSIWQEMLDKTSAEAQAQWASNGTDDYKYRIQSCYNCRHWCKDATLMGDYAWNRCRIEERNFWGALGTRFDYCCPDYLGFEKELNITWLELWNKGVIGWALDEITKRKAVSE